MNTTGNKELNQVVTPEMRNTWDNMNRETKTQQHVQRWEELEVWENL